MTSGSAVEGGVCGVRFVPGGSSRLANSKCTHDTQGRTRQVMAQFPGHSGEGVPVPLPASPELTLVGQRGSEWGEGCLRSHGVARLSEEGVC